MAALLTTLTNAEAWINLTPGDTATDAIITRLIAAATSSILAYIGRPSILPQTYTETRDGTGGPRLMLRHWPVTAVSALTIGPCSVLAGSYSGTPGATGWCGFFFDPWDGIPPGRRTSLELNGYTFWRAAQNIAITYTAGYLVANEAVTVGSTGAPANSAMVAQPYGSWAVDRGVTYANGTPLTLTAGAPAMGQYQLSPTVPGLYLFNTADDGAAVLLNYGFIPAAIEEACCQLVAERYSYRDRVGQRSKSLGGQESIAFDRSPIAPEVKQLLSPYRAVAPI